MFLEKRNVNRKPCLNKRIGFAFRYTSLLRSKNPNNKDRMGQIIEKAEDMYLSSCNESNEKSKIAYPFFNKVIGKRKKRIRFSKQQSFTSVTTISNSVRPSKLSTLILGFGDKKDSIDRKKLILPNYNSHHQYNRSKNIFRARKWRNRRHQPQQYQYDHPPSSSLRLSQRIPIDDQNILCWDSLKHLHLGWKLTLETMEGILKALANVSIISSSSCCLQSLVVRPKTFMYLSASILKALVRIPTLQRLHLQGIRIRSDNASICENSADENDAHEDALKLHNSLSKLSERKTTNSSLPSIPTTTTRKQNLLSLCLLPELESDSSQESSAATLHSSKTGSPSSSVSSGINISNTTKRRQLSVELVQCGIRDQDCLQLASLFPEEVNQQSQITATTTTGPTSQSLPCVQQERRTTNCTSSFLLDGNNRANSREISLTVAGNRRLTGIGVAALILYGNTKRLDVSDCALTCRDMPDITKALLYLKRKKDPNQKQLEELVMARNYRLSVSSDVSTSSRRLANGSRNHYDHDDNNSNKHMDNWNAFIRACTLTPPTALKHLDLSDCNLSLDGHVVPLLQLLQDPDCYLESLVLRQNCFNISRYAIIDKHSSSTATANLLRLPEILCDVVANNRTLRSLIWTSTTGTTTTSYHHYSDDDDDHLLTQNDQMIKNVEYNFHLLQRLSSSLSKNYRLQNLQLDCLRVELRQEEDEYLNQIIEDRHHPPARTRADPESISVPTTSAAAAAATTTTTASAGSRANTNSHSSRSGDHRVQFSLPSSRCLLQEKAKREIDFWLRLNRAGRQYLLKGEKGMGNDKKKQKIAIVPNWSYILENSSHQPDILFWLLRNGVQELGLA